MNATQKYGGYSLDITDALRIIQQLSAIDLSLGLLVWLSNSLAVILLLKFWNENLKTLYLPQLAKGKTLGVFALTESKAGPNPAAIETEAYQQPDDSSIFSGENLHWSCRMGRNTYWKIGRCYSVDKKPLGFSCFLVDADTSDVTIGAEIRTLGLRSTVQNILYFNKVKISAERL